MNGVSTQLRPETAVMMLKYWALLFIAAIIGGAVLFVIVMRALSRSRFVIRLTGQGQEKWYKCPDCSGGAQLRGRPIPVHLHRDKGRDKQGWFFQSRDANVNTCDTCRGRGWLFTETDDVKNGRI